MFSSHIFRYFYSLPQQLQIRRDNAQGPDKTRPSLMCLPDDLLIMILDILHHEARNPKWTENWALHKLLAMQAQAAKGCLQAFLNLSTSNKRMRALAAPKLHRVLHLGPSWGTERLQKAAAEIGRNENALTYARELNVDLWMACSATGIRETQFAAHIALIVPSFTQLTKLAITVTEGSAAALQIAFEKSGDEYPGITDLKLSPHMGWLIALCPNVCSVSTNDWIMSYASPTDELAFVDQAAKAARLQHFSIHCRWNRNLMATILERLSHVSSLSFPGCSILPELLLCLKQHPRLERLDLVHAQRLMNSMPMSPALMLAREQSRGQRQSRSKITWNQEVITRMIFSELPKLKRLSLGHDFKAMAVLSAKEEPLTVKWECLVPEDLKQPHLNAWFSRETGALVSSTDQNMDRLLADLRTV